MVSLGMGKGTWKLNTLYDYENYDNRAILKETHILIPSLIFLLCFWKIQKSNH